MRKFRINNANLAKKIAITTKNKHAQNLGEKYTRSEHAMAKKDKTI